MQPPITSSIAVLDYPVLRFAHGMLFPARSPSDLDECTKVALKNGIFEGLLLVDASGRTMAVQSARKLRGVGPFWGYNIFLNQRIKVDLVLRAAPALAFEDVREKVLMALRGPQRWHASADVGDLQGAIAGAASIRELAIAVTDAYHPRHPEQLSLRE